MCQRGTTFVVFTFIFNYVNLTRVSLNLDFQATVIKNQLKILENQREILRRLPTTGAIDALDPNPLPNDNAAVPLPIQTIQEWTQFNDLLASAEIFTYYVWKGTSKPMIMKIIICY